MTISEKVRQLDAFGYPVALTYEGKQHYQTRYGGVVSLIVIFIGFLYAGIRFTYMITRASP